MLAGHKSKETSQIIKNYFQSNPNYPENLKNKVLEAAWTLMKQVPYVEKPNPKVVKAKTTTSKRK